MPWMVTREFDLFAIKVLKHQGGYNGSGKKCKHWGYRVPLRKLH